MPVAINSSCPVEKLHEACHPWDGVFGVAVPITFSVLDHIQDLMPLTIRSKRTERIRYPTNM